MLTVGAEEGTELLTIASDDHLLTLTPARGDFSDGIVNDNAIRYNNVLPDVDYQYTVFGNSVKEDIILLQRHSPQLPVSVEHLWTESRPERQHAVPL